MVSRCGNAYIGEGNVVGVGTLVIGRVGDDVGPPLARSIGIATPISRLWCTQYSLWAYA